MRPNRQFPADLVTFMKKPLTLFRMGFFGAAHGWVGEGGFGPPSLKLSTHILQ